MPEEQQSLTEIVQAAAKEAHPKGASETSPKEPTAPSESAPKEGEGLQGLTPNLRRIYEARKDQIDALPEESKKVVLESIADMEKGFHRDRETVGENQRLRETLENAGVTIDDLNDLASRKQRGEPIQRAEVTAAATEAAKEAKGLSRMMAQATDPATREALRDLRQALVEELTDLVESHPTTKSLRQSVQRLEGLTTTRRTTDADTEIDKLEEVYPASLVEKYRANMRYLAGRQEFSQSTMEDILFKVASAKEIRESASTKPVQPKQQTTQPAGAQTVTSVKPNEADLEKYKGKKGGFNLDGFVRDMANRAMTKVSGTG